MLRSLADPQRRALFERLCREGELTVSALTAAAGVSQPAVSKHLAVLKRAGLVHGRAQGRLTHYRADPDALRPLTDWAVEQRSAWARRLDQLESLLDRMDT